LGLAPVAAVAPKVAAAAPSPPPPMPFVDLPTAMGLPQPGTVKTYQYRYLGLAPLKNEGGSYHPDPADDGENQA
jgi:hypothetical protein